MPRLLRCMAGHFSLALPVNSARPVKTKLLEPPELFVSSHYPTQNRFALLLEML
ncbi:hypothetical protein [Brucella intermedia]|uniref:hypothetical protein n=1 Tax=Brucella intermedia TaxID=94625 RepID=UPI00178C1D09|nr:hypothetical protein [Brucella intermedia]